MALRVLFLIVFLCIGCGSEDPEFRKSFPNGAKVKQDLIGRTIMYSNQIWVFDAEDKLVVNAPNFTSCSSDKISGWISIYTSKDKKYWLVGELGLEYKLVDGKWELSRLWASSTLVRKVME